MVSALVPQKTNGHLSLQVEHSEALILRLWDEARDQWLKKIWAKSRGPNTRNAYELAVGQFFEWADVKPWQVTTGLVQGWVNWLRDEGKVTKSRKTGKVLNRAPLAEASINQKLAALRSFYDHVGNVFSAPMGEDRALEYFLSKGLLHLSYGGHEVTLWPADRSNPFNPKAIERTKVSAFGRAETLTAQEFSKMVKTINFDCLTGLRDYALLYAYFHTCRRNSEIRCLRWGDIEPDDNGHYVFTYRYKGGESRKQQMHRTVYKAICNYLRAAGRLDGMKAEDYIFTPLDTEIAKQGYAPVDWEGTGPISAVQCNNILKKYARRAKVDPKKAHIHALRHGGLKHRVRLMKEQGRVDYDEIRQLAGHSTLAITDVYVRTVAETPDDPTGDDAAKALQPKKRLKRPRLDERTAAYAA